MTHSPTMVAISTTATTTTLAVTLRPKNAAAAIASNAGNGTQTMSKRSEGMARGCAKLIVQPSWMVVGNNQARVVGLVIDA